MILLLLFILVSEILLYHVEYSLFIFIFPPLHPNTCFHGYFQSQYHSLSKCQTRKGNYLLWRFQFLPLLKLHDLEGLIDGTFLCLVRFLPSTEKDVQLTINLEYTLWIKLDQVLLCWLIFSLTETVLAHVVGLTTSRDVWCSLKRIFTSPSRARVQQLKYQLYTIKMGTSSMSKYIQSVKSIVDNLTALPL